MNTTSSSASTSTTITKGMSRSQPVSPAPRTPTPKMTIAGIRRPASSDGLRRISETGDVDSSRHKPLPMKTMNPDSRHLAESNGSNNVSQSDVTSGRRHVMSSRPLNKMKSDSSLPPSHQQLRHVRQLRHRVTINTIPVTASSLSSSSMAMTSSSASHHAQRSHSSSNLIPPIAPLAEIAEYSNDLDLGRMRLSEAAGLSDPNWRRFEPPVLVINDTRKSLSLTKIAEKSPVYISASHIRRNASWTTMTAAINP